MDESLDLPKPFPPASGNNETHDFHVLRISCFVFDFICISVFLSALFVVLALFYNFSFVVYPYFVFCFFFCKITELFSNVNGFETLSHDKLDLPAANRGAFSDLI